MLVSDNKDIARRKKGRKKVRVLEKSALMSRGHSRSDILSARGGSNAW